MTEPHEELPIKIGTEGASAAPPKTVLEVFRKCVEEHGENTALKFQKVSEVNEGTFVWNIPVTFRDNVNISYEEYFRGNRGGGRLLFIGTLHDILM